MRIFLFLTLFIFVITICTIYIKKRFIDKFTINSKFKKILILILYMNYCGVFVYILFRYYAIEPNWLFNIISFPIGIIFLLFCISITYDIINILIKKIPLEPARRNFLKKSIDIGFIASSIGLTTKSAINIKNYIIETVNIKIKKLKKPYKIIQLSDIHIGGLIDKNFIINLVNKVNTLDADLIVITGDLVDSKFEYSKHILNELKNLRSVYGTYFVVGNHEYFHGVKKIINHLTKLNIKVLENENVYIGPPNKGFNLAGVYDLFGYKIKKFVPNLTKALNNTKQSPIVLLAHQPKYIHEVTKNVDLVLSGHTHGGQIAPFNFLVYLSQTYVKGLHQHNKYTKIYVNKGTGFWGPPMRLGTNSEITIINLS